MTGTQSLVRSRRAAGVAIVGCNRGSTGYRVWRRGSSRPSGQRPRGPRSQRFRRARRHRASRSSSASPRTCRRRSAPARSRPRPPSAAKAFRLTTLWSPGQTARLRPSERSSIARPRHWAGQRIVLAVYADAGFGGAAGRREPRRTYCGYVRTLLTTLSDRSATSSSGTSRTRASSGARRPAPRRCTSSSWRAATTCWTDFGRERDRAGAVLDGQRRSPARPRPARSSAASATPTVRAAAARRCCDTVGYHPYGLTAAERPWRRHIASKTIALGDWNKLMYNLFLAFGGTAQPIPGEAGVRIWYTESASQTAVDAGEGRATTPGRRTCSPCPDDAGGEPDAPAPAETTSAPDQCDAGSRRDPARRLPAVRRPRTSTSSSRTSHASPAGSPARTGPI